MKTTESREASEVSPSLLLHSLFMWQLWSVFLSECVQWRTPPEFAPSSFVQFIASGPQRHANDTEVWGNWARRHWEAAGRRLLRCFFALPFITHLPLDMVRRHRFVFQAYWTLCRSINSQIGPQIASLCTPTEEWTGYCSWQMFYNIPCFCVFYHILVRSLSVFRFAPICCVNLTVAVVGC